jgi:hypothetical protein
MLVIDHSQGPGKMVKSGPCPVRFYKLVPKNLGQFPVIIWIVFGTHNHSPPALLKTPRQIYISIFNLIQRIGIPNLSRSKYKHVLDLLETC